MDTLLRKIRGSVIPLATTAELGRAVRRTLVLRILFGATLIALAVAATEAGGGNADAARGLLNGKSGGVLVLDVSRSIKPESNRTITAVLQRLISSHTRIGLVAFSDIAYELLPPGSPSSELRPLLRYFAPARPRPGADPYPPNPWTTSFSGGTQISAGVTLGHTVLVDAGEPKGEILLVSDLDTAPDDVPRVAQTFNTFRNEGVSLRIVPVAPRADNLSLFQSIAGKKAFTTPVHAAGGGLGQTQGSSRGGIPWGLVAIALAVLALLAANEHWCGRLPLPRTQS